MDGQAHTATTDADGVAVFRNLPAIDSVIVTTTPSDPSKDVGYFNVLAGEIKHVTVDLNDLQQTNHPVKKNSVADNPTDKQAPPENDAEKKPLSKEELGRLAQEHIIRSQAEQAGFSTEQAKDIYKSFAKIYSLSEGDILKRIPQPFDDVRLKYYRLTQGGQARAIPSGPATMYVRWKDDKPQIWGMTFGGNDRSIQDLVSMMAQVFGQELSGEEALINKSIAGDWVYDPDASRTDIIEALEHILNEQGIKVNLEFRDVEREVYVCKGTYDLTPLNPQRKRIEIFGTKLNTNPNRGGGGSGNLDEFLQWTGRWIGEFIVNEVETPPKDNLSWHQNLDIPFTELDEQLAKDPELVTTNITIQTGLTFTKEKRKVRLLFIEPTETTDSNN